MSDLKFVNINKIYDNNVQAVFDFNLEIKDKEFIVFVGPSGCGKSTTLRMIAGLEEISAGELFIDDVLVNNVEPKNRDIAFVFQNYALYPHMTVYENMEFGLKCHKVAFKTLNENGNEVIEYRKLTKEEINKKILEAADILEITNYLDRKPKEMSGGQRQRVALGRALVRDPKVFLLDEPLSNLDAKLRTQMRTEITKLHKKIGTTFIYVTHDQTEAMTMGTRIVVMKDGFVQQIDTPLNLYNHPINKFVAGFIGTPQMNFYSTHLLLNGKNVEVKLNNNVSFSVPYEEIKKIDYSYLDGTKEVIIGCRPEHVKMGKGLKCVVNVVEKLGNETILYCSLENNEQIITKEEAIRIATERDKKIETRHNIATTEAQIGIDKMNADVVYREKDIENYNKGTINYECDENGTYKIKDNAEFYKVDNRVRKVWEVKIFYDYYNEYYQERYVYYVDATTGEIIGGNSWSGSTEQVAQLIESQYNLIEK